MHRKRHICLILAFVSLLLLCACPSDSTTEPPPEPEPSFSLEEQTTARSGIAAYAAPDFTDAVFNASEAVGNGNSHIDLSSVSQGYVAVSAVSESRLKFQVIKDDFTYNYDISSQGLPSVFPLQSGDGEYRFRIMENVTESKYTELYSAIAEVVLADEFQPFIRPNSYVNYSRASNCVKIASDLASTAANAPEAAAEIYRFIVANIRYDPEKAATVKSGYLPDPDETLAAGKGICFDYASLAAAMLRSQGIPAKLICGYVAPNDLYHAWNMFYTPETGWVTVEYEVRGDSWNRIDLTFAAGGANSDFIGDGSNYTDLYTY